MTVCILLIFIFFNIAIQIYLEKCKSVQLMPRFFWCHLFGYTHTHAHTHTQTCSLDKFKVNTIGRFKIYWQNIERVIDNW